MQAYPQKIVTLLGFCPATLPIVLETWVAQHGPIGASVTLVENIVPATADIQYLPPGIVLNRVMAADWEPGDDDHYALAVGGPGPREAVFRFFQTAFGIGESQYISIIHPAAVVPGSATVEPGVLIEPGVVVSSFAQVHFGAVIKRGSSVGHHSVLGRFSSINPGVTVCGRVSIGNQCLIGAGAIVTDMVSIGPLTTIGAGSLVNKEIPGGVVAYGSPCKVVR